MTLQDRHRLAFVVVALISVFALAAYFRPVHSESKAPKIDDVPLSKYEDRLIALDRAALDEAYREQIHHLFAVWMKDDTGQPGRAVVGARKARKAYEDAWDGIERREQMLKGQNK